MADRGGIIDGVIDGIVDGIVERVGIIIRGVGSIKRIIIERVNIFPEMRSRHFPFFATWKVVVDVENSEDSEDGSLSTVVLT